MLVNNYFFFAVVSWISWLSELDGLEVRPLGDVLKVGALDVWSKPFTPQEETRSSLMIEWHCAEGGILVRMYLSLSILFRCVYFLVCPMYKSRSASSRLLSEETMLCIAVYFVHERRGFQEPPMSSSLKAAPK